MPRHPKTSFPFPSREEILRFIHESTGTVGKREIARAFRLDSKQKMELKKLLREMELDGTLQKGRGKQFAEPGTLPPVSVVEVTGVDIDGEVLAKPVPWEHNQPAPLIYMSPEKRGHPALGFGDRVLARLSPTERTGANDAPVYEGKTIRLLTASSTKIMGMLEDVGGRFRLRPTDKRTKSEVIVEFPNAEGASNGDLVRAELLPGRHYGLKHARVVENLANADNPRAASIIAIHDHGLPVEFPSDALHQADTAIAAPMDKREDLRDVPLVTIDGADARDFDDAVWAEADDKADNKGGWHIIVAIADVSWYVHPDSALDKAAYTRGNSVYFPDRVVPMLPEALSNGWCSLVPHEERPCLAVHMWLSEDGALLRHRFCRAMIRSHARLTYAQAQAAHDGETDNDGQVADKELLESVITPLYGAYAALSAARKKRGVLELNIPERQVLIGEDGSVSEIVQRERFDSHKLIEEFMIAANVAAAETLEKRQQPCLYRIHDQPSMEKMEMLREFLATLDLPIPKGQVMRAAQFNGILDKVADTPKAEMVNTVILRSQSQAEYNPDNIGHFGLNLMRYCHFTSPIRRYSDLIVHRALIRGLKLGDGGLETDHLDFHEMGTHLSATERRAAAAERDATDRFTAGYLSVHVGGEFTGRITGVTRFGLFVMLDDSGADGLIPISTLPDDYYRHDEAAHCLRGDHSGREFSLGQRLAIILAEADAITGGMVLRLTDKEAASGPVSSGRRPGKNKPRSSKGQRLAKRGNPPPRRKR